jgi:hypothetical protein
MQCVTPFPAFESDANSSFLRAEERVPWQVYLRLKGERFSDFSVDTT